MTIARHNYEEFFLLYIDNELNVEQKKQVEAFVLANPDLEEEFVMLQQSKLVADDSFVFEGKENLMKEESIINMSNYEEWLILYVDNELTGEQKLAVEKFAAANPRVKAELDLFLQTKLEPGEFVFADKASLYKREEKWRVIKMSWWRMAAAAVLLIAAGWGTYSIITNNGSKKINTAGNIPVKSTQQDQKASGRIVNEKQEDTQLNPENQNSLASKENSNKKIENKKGITRPKQDIENNKTLARIDEPSIRNKPNEETVSSRANESSTSIIDRTNITSSIAVNPSSGKLLQHPINTPAVTKPGDETPHDTKASNLTQPDDATASNDENKKLRGFFRRAARFIERTTKVNPANDDNKVLIGSMAVSLK